MDDILRALARSVRTSLECRTVRLLVRGTVGQVKDAIFRFDLSELGAMLRKMGKGLEECCYYGGASDFALIHMGHLADLLGYEYDIKWVYDEPEYHSNSIDLSQRKRSNSNPLTAPISKRLRCFAFLDRHLKSNLQCRLGYGIPPGVHQGRRMISR